MVLSKQLSEVEEVEYCELQLGNLMQKMESHSLGWEEWFRAKKTERLIRIDSEQIAEWLCIWKFSSLMRMEREVQNHVQ